MSQLLLISQSDQIRRWDRNFSNFGTFPPIADSEVVSEGEGTVE